VLYASTNKVYGDMGEVGVVEDASRYRYADRPLGIDEQQPLDFHSPYGCSKGCGDQYVRDYHRIYGLSTVVLRQSCIYGPRQFGLEDQGWVAWFAIAAVTGRPITVYGDGKQVRDLLHVDDLCACYDRVVERIDTVAGRVYNVGGGPAQTLAVWSELGPLLSSCLGRPVPAGRGPWRPGDQRVYVSDVRRARSELDWAPTVAVNEGVRSLISWVSANRHLFDDLP
jgi:CDP-paratose 2-epimerase